MPWSRRFEDPITLPNGKTLHQARSLSRPYRNDRIPQTWIASRLHLQSTLS